MSDSGATPPPGAGPGNPADDPIGSVSEEAAKLLGALTGWAREQGTGMGHSVSDTTAHAAAAAHTFNEHFATGSADCLYCPVCRVVHYVRTTSPEVKTHLAIAASSLLQAASALMETQVPSATPESAVEKIDVGDDSDWPSPEGWDAE